MLSWQNLTCLAGLGYFNLIPPFIYYSQVWTTIPILNQISLGWCPGKTQVWEEHSVSEDNCLHRRRNLGYVCWHFGDSTSRVVADAERTFGTMIANIVCVRFLCLCVHVLVEMKCCIKDQFLSRPGKMYLLFYYSSLILCSGQWNGMNERLIYPTT